jgi:hypothetical protein
MHDEGVKGLLDHHSEGNLRTLCVALLQEMK